MIEETPLFDTSATDGQSHEAAYEQEPDSVTDTSSPSEATQKKKKMIKFAAIGVASMFVAAIAFTSYSKAQAKKAAQIGLDMEDPVQAQVPPAAPATPVMATLPAAPEPVPAPQRALTAAIAPASSVSAVAAPQPTPFAPASGVAASGVAAPSMPGQALPVQENYAAILSDFGLRITALEDSMKQTHDMLVSMQHLTAPAKHPRRKPRFVAHDTLVATRHSAAVTPQPEVKTLVLTPVPVVEAAPSATPISPVAVIAVTPAPQIPVTVKVADSGVNACDLWSVKAAVPGMAWIERDNKLVVIKAGDPVQDGGSVVSIDSRVFEVKTTRCTIR